MYFYIVIFIHFTLIDIRRQQPCFPCDFETRPAYGLAKCVSSEEVKAVDQRVLDLFFLI